jgi:hypothetical protein
MNNLRFHNLIAFLFICYFSTNNIYIGVEHIRSRRLYNKMKQFERDNPEEVSEQLTETKESFFQHPKLLLDSSILQAHHKKLEEYCLDLFIQEEIPMKSYEEILKTFLVFNIEQYEPSLIKPLTANFEEKTTTDLSEPISTPFKPLDIFENFISDLFFLLETSFKNFFYLSVEKKI